MITRRSFLGTAAAGAALAQSRPPAQFQVACMTIPFQQFPFEQGVKGVAAAGFRYLAWGPNQVDSGQRRIPTIALEAGADRARELARISRDAGFEAVLMFASFYPENPGAVDAHKRRIDQAQAAGIPNLLAFGSPKGTADQRPAFVATLRAVADHARQAGVTVGVKQHGGVTATGELTASVVREVNHPAVVVYYDAGNTWWYANVDANSDFARCAPLTRGFAIKDFRALNGKRATCGAGFGQTDHYAMLGTVAANGGKIPLCCENIAEPFLARPDSFDAVVDLARRSRLFLDTVTAGVRGATVRPSLRYVVEPQVRAA